MNQATTAIILRPKDSEPVRVLECDGPGFTGSNLVHHSPGFYSPTLSFEEYMALPDHIKNLPPHPESMDFDSAHRIANIVGNAIHTSNITSKQLREIMWRIELLYPGSTWRWPNACCQTSTKSA